MQSIFISHPPDKQCSSGYSMLAGYRLVLQTLSSRATYLHIQRLVSSNMLIIKFALYLVAWLCHRMVSVWDQSQKSYCDD